MCGYFFCHLRFHLPEIHRKTSKQGLILVLSLLAVSYLANRDIHLIKDFVLNVAGKFLEGIYLRPWTVNYYQATDNIVKDVIFND